MDVFAPIRTLDTPRVACGLVPVQNWPDTREIARFPDSRIILRNAFPGSSPSGDVALFPVTVAGAAPVLHRLPFASSRAGSKPAIAV